MALRKCTICHKPIVLEPTATERANRLGGTFQYYLDLFTSHSQCAINKRNQETSQLMQRLS